MSRMSYASPPVDDDLVDAVGSCGRAHVVALDATTTTVHVAPVAVRALDGDDFGPGVLSSSRSFGPLWVRGS